MAPIPKLAMIPSGYKAGKIYSVLPTNGIGDFDFTRASSATRVNASGLIETVATGVPRLEYPLVNGAVNGCPSLLLEPQSTNLALYSEDFSNSYWTTSRIETPYISDVLSPEGALNAYTLEISSGETNGGGVFKTGLSISGDNSFSVFAKKKTSKYLALGDGNLTVNGVWFDLENGTIGTQYNAIGEIEEFGNGWYKCTMKYTLTSSNAKFIYQSNTNGATSLGVVGGDSVYIFGAQLEQNSYPTSYIPTSGSAVTRVADACTNGGNDQVINNIEGTIFINCDFINNNGVQVLCSPNDNAFNKRIEIWANSGLVTGFIGGSSNITIGSSALVNGNHKIALAYKSGNSSFYIDGVLIGSKSDSFTISALTQLTLGYFNGNQYMSESKTKDVRVYNTALTDAELITLTTL